MLSGKAQNVHFILSNSYIGLKMTTVFFFNHTEMNKKLSFDDHYEQWLLLIAKGTRQNNCSEIQHRFTPAVHIQHTISS